MNDARDTARQSPWEVLWLLLRLRLQGLRRKGATGRAGGTGQRGIRAWARHGVLVVVTVVIAFSGASLLSNVVGGTVGRLLLGALLTWASTAATVLLFLLAIAAVLAAFTYNSDLKLLLLTPISPRLLMVEKFVTLYVQIAPFMLLLGIPVLLGVGRTLDLGAGYSLASIVALLILPLAPLALAMLVLLAVLRWVPPRMARTFTAVFGTLLALTFYIGIQVLHSRGGKLQTSNLQGMFSQVPHAWWDNLPTTWVGQGLTAATQGQTRTAVSFLAAATVLGVVLAGAVVLLYARLFASGWATYQEAGRRGRPRKDHRFRSFGYAPRGDAAERAMDDMAAALPARPATSRLERHPARRWPRACPPPCLEAR